MVGEWEMNGRVGAWLVNERVSEWESGVWVHGW